mmetsp:Transcript_56134/g.122966  ORF Transcript_56134/g.122966 Transcript_56134/m.122966 type:complete len:204 (-) Transcript_56134:1134-1745(-)
MPCPCLVSTIFRLHVGGLRWNISIALLSAGRVTVSVTGALSARTTAGAVVHDQTESVSTVKVPPGTSVYCHASEHRGPPQKQTRYSVTDGSPRMARLLKTLRVYPASVGPGLHTLPMQPVPPTCGGCTPPHRSGSDDKTSFSLLSTPDDCKARPSLCAGISIPKIRRLNGRPEVTCAGSNPCKIVPTPPESQKYCKAPSANLL